MRRLAVGTVTLAMTVAYGALLTWLLKGGHYLPFAGCIALSIVATYWIASPAERSDFAADIRRIIERCRR